MQNDIAISVKNLTKVYHLYDSPKDRLKEALNPFGKSYHHDFYALKDVSFEIKKGETIGIIGKNGAGKSTLLKIITGVLTPTSGEVQVNGKIASLLELGAGFNPEMTGLENIYLNGTIMGFTKEEMDTKVDAILAFADIGEFIHQPVKMYSSGMFARLAFSVAINVEPDVLIVDEVLSVGDVAFQVKCFQKFRDFKEMGKTILFVSHSTDQIVQLCSRVYWFEQGTIYKSGIAKELAQEYHALMTHGVETKKVENSNMKIDIESLTGEWDIPPLAEGIDWNGEGGMKVTHIGLFDTSHKLISTISQQERVSLVYIFQTFQEILNPFLSFILIDKHGNRILGASNMTESIQFKPLRKGETVKVTFEFDMPELANGEYLISVGLNDGVQDLHVRHQYITDAYKVIFQCITPKQKQATLLKLYDVSLQMSIES